MEKKAQNVSGLENGPVKTKRRNKTAYMIAVLVFLVAVAVIAFCIDKKVKGDKDADWQEENSATEEGEADTMLTAYGALRQDELLECLKLSVVRIEAEGDEPSITLSGSGVIIEMTDMYVDIATASHVVAQSAEPLIYFIDGSAAYGRVLAYGELSDVAFIRVDLAAMQDGNVAMLQPAKCADNEDYELLQPEEQVYMVGSVSRVAGEVIQGKIKEKELFVPLFQNDMLLCENTVMDGMSGGGTFSAEGKLIGIIVGTDDTDTANVAITDVMAEYRSISE